MNKAEDRADLLTHEQSGMEGMAELKAKVDKRCFLHSFVFHLFYSALKRIFSFGTQQ